MSAPRTAALLLLAAVLGASHAAAQEPVPTPAPATPVPAAPAVDSAAVDVALQALLPAPPPFLVLAEARPPLRRPLARARRAPRVVLPRRVRTWKRGVELAANVFFGNRPQTVLTSGARASHADSTFELSADVRFTYGESTRDDVRQVSQRLWLGNLTLDLWPFAANSPFVLATVESSLEKRIRLRTSGGVGHKFTFRDDEEALANFSVALLGERSRLLTAAGEPFEQTLARFSARLRLRRQLGTRASVSHETFFRPEYANLDQYTLSNSASAGYRLNETMQLKVTYQDNYDTEARGRGASSNYDGQLVVGLAADW